MQKIKNILHRRRSQGQIPEAPPAPAPLVAPAVASAPLTSSDLLAQRETLNHLDTAAFPSTSFDRNGDGLIDTNDNLAGNRLSQGYIAPLTAESYGSYVQSAQRASIIRSDPTVIETIEKDVVIQERIHPIEKEEIQPIIYREREQLDVRQITQMMHETQIQPTLIEQRELAAEYRDAVIERSTPIEENIILPTTQRDATLRTQQVHAAIVNETIKKTVIEEIQPVLERDVFIPTVVQNTQPIYEKIIEAPIVYREIRAAQDIGSRSVEIPGFGNYETPQNKSFFRNNNLNNVNGVNNANLAASPLAGKANVMMQ